MIEIDRNLVTSGVEISSRSLYAAREVAIRFDINLPLDDGPHSEISVYYPLSMAIKEWYTEMYGGRSAAGGEFGNACLKLDGDFYKLRLPWVIGQVHFSIAREFTSEPTLGRAPQKVNILQLIEGMTEKRASLLSYEALQHLCDQFLDIYAASSLLLGTQHRYMHMARGDIAMAVTNLLRTDCRFGEAKWASLQAAEKVIKTAIVLNGDTPKRVHDLSILMGQLDHLNITATSQPLIDQIQCTPAIRYGDEGCSSDDAYHAHQASLKLIVLLYRSGARFTKA